VFNHLVFADSSDEAAKQWLAAAYEQLGFQSEAGTWRNIYLVGAKELREGNNVKNSISTANAKVLSGIPAVDLFDAMATRFNPAKMQGDGGILRFWFPDRKEAVSIDLGKSVMFPRREDYAITGEGSDVQITISRAEFTKLLMRETSPMELIRDKQMIISGNDALMATMFLALDEVKPQFDIVTP
jgi:alkyl sulfatase BDS1-like metallo-beta-lactamase superfamily hydrolase